MKLTRRLPAVLVLLALLAGAVLVSAGDEGRPAAAREFVVVYADAARPAPARQAIAAAGGRIVAENAAVGVATVRSADPRFATRARGDRALVGVMPNAPVGRATAARAPRPASTPPAAADATRQAAAPGREPLADRQWDMRLIGATATRSYAVQQGSRDVLVGIIDTGIDASHPDIRANFDRERSRNFTRDRPSVDGLCRIEPDRSCADPPTVDEDGHGTHVAGTIGAPINRLGMAGVAPGVRLVNLRAGQDSGYFFIQPVVDALTYAGDIGVDVVNMSFYVDPWRFNCPANPADSEAEQAEQRTIIEAMERALAYARERGVTLLAAIGNEHENLNRPGIDRTSPNFPAGRARPRRIGAGCVDLPVQGTGVIGVSAIGPTARKAIYSDYGAGQVDVAAPGGDRSAFPGTARFNTLGNTVLGPYPRSVARARGEVDERGRPLADGLVRECSPTRCGLYQWLEGTSMASPHAAGVAALVVAANGTPDAARGGLTLDPARTEEILKATATDTACPQPRLLVYRGGGRGAVRPLGRRFNAFCGGPPSLNGFYGAGIVNAAAAARPAAPAAPPAA